MASNDEKGKGEKPFPDVYRCEEEDIPEEGIPSGGALVAEGARPGFPMGTSGMMAPEVGHFQNPQNVPMAPAHMFPQSSMHIPHYTGPGAMMQSYVGTFGPTPSSLYMPPQPWSAGQQQYPAHIAASTASWQSAAELVATARQIQMERMEKMKQQQQKEKMENKSNESDDEIETEEGEEGPSAGHYKGTAVMGMPVKRMEPSGEGDDGEPQPLGEKVIASFEEDKGSGSDRKSRLIWTQELHNRFINALSHLGLKQAVPKNILGLMNVEGMTRENVASHLQKYRLYLKKIGGYKDKDKVDPDLLQKLHEQNVEHMASQQAMQQSMAFMTVGFDAPNAAQGGFGNFPPHFQTEMTVSGSESCEPHGIVDGIPLDEADPSMILPVSSIPTTNINAASTASMSVSPTITMAMETGRFDPAHWQYPTFPDGVLPGTSSAPASVLHATQVKFDTMPGTSQFDVQAHAFHYSQDEDQREEEDPEVIFEDAIVDEGSDAQGTRASQKIENVEDDDAAELLVAASNHLDDV